MCFNALNIIIIIYVPEGICHTTAALYILVKISRGHVKTCCWKWNLHYIGEFNINATTRTLYRYICIIYHIPVCEHCRSIYTYRLCTWLCASLWSPYENADWHRLSCNQGRKRHFSTLVNSYTSGGARAVAEWCRAGLGGGNDFRETIIIPYTDYYTS